MVDVQKPWEFKEEVDIMEDEGQEQEEDTGALHTRNRKSKAALDSHHGEPAHPFSFNAAEEEKEEEEQKQSVFLDSTNVADNATDSITEQEVTKVGQSDCEEQHHNENAEGKGLEKKENFNAQENNTNARTSELENGLHSKGVKEPSSSSSTTADGEAEPKLIANRSDVLAISSSITNRTQVHEIEVEKDENVKGKVNIEEYDLEKILDEQETHDLYCPKCKSCITRRVILRKRKRTVRPDLRDEPQKKPLIEEPSVDTSYETAVERHDQDAPEVFRCLSCFTFFIPEGCGFNIFRIFDCGFNMNQRVNVQHPPASRDSENCGSWLLSCFQTVDSPKNSSHADTAKDPLLSGSQNTSDQISSVDNNTESANIHAINGKNEQPKNPSSAGSFSTAQTSAKKKEEIEHGTTPSVTIDTSFSAGSFSTAQTSAKKKEEIEHGTTPSVTIDASSSTTIRISTSQSKPDVPQNPFFDKESFGPGIKFPDAIPSKIFPGVNNLLNQQKPTSVIPPPVQSESGHVSVPIITDDVPPAPVPRSAQRDEWDILKAVVYGGLAESITSLSVVSAAAASGAKTLDIFILGIANLIGGLPVILHNIADLRYLEVGNENDELVDHYRSQLGRRSRYRLHMVIAVLSYILFGLLPPVIYGLSFRNSDNRENKMMVVAAASLACVALLAVGKAHVNRPRTYYFTTVLYYLSIGLSGSGLSYAAGVVITKLLAHFGLIDGGAAPAPPALLLPDAVGAGVTAWASY